MVLDDNEKGPLFVDIVGLQLDSWPIKYLGLPACVSRLHVCDQDPSLIR